MRQKKNYHANHDRTPRCSSGGNNPVVESLYEDYLRGPCFRTGGMA